jgi:hypothetical protein
MIIDAMTGSESGAPIVGQLRTLKRRLLTLIGCAWMIDWHQVQQEAGEKCHLKSLSFAAYMAHKFHNLSYVT